MAFYIYNQDHIYVYSEDVLTTSYVYSEDGSIKHGLSPDKKGYDTEAAAQAVIDSNPTWIATEISNGATFLVIERN